jgi:hypothetical protein
MRRNAQHLIGNGRENNGVRESIMEKFRILLRGMVKTPSGHYYRTPSTWLRGVGGVQHTGPGKAKSYLPGVRKGAFLLSTEEWAEKYPGRRDRPRSSVAC